MKRRSKKLQYDFFKSVKDEFGGSLLKGNPKRARPLDSKLPTHLSLKSDKSCLRLPCVLKTVNDLVEQVSKKYGFKIYKYSNVGNHLHLLLKISKRRRWNAFIRELTGRIATDVRELLPNLDLTTFWAERPFTRIVRGWRKAFQIAKDYIHLNQLEALGLISRKEMKTTKELHEFWDLVHGTS